MARLVLGLWCCGHCDAAAAGVDGKGFVPSVRPLPSGDIDTGWPVKFRNFANRPMKLYWVSFEGKATMSGPAAVPGNGGTLSFQTYRTHEFFWGEENAEPPIESDAEGRVGSRLVVTDTVRLYYYYDDTTVDWAHQELQEELDHMTAYRAKTGRHWVATSWPRPEVTYETWHPTHIGQKIEVDSSMVPKSGQFTCTEADVQDCYGAGTKNKRGALDTRKVSQATPGNFTIEVMSLEPRVFRIENFLTDFEAEYMISEATPMLHQSTTGNGADAKVQLNLRRSKSAWLHHGHSNVVDTIYERLGVVTKVGSKGVDGTHCEAMNVLNYPKGGQYQDHFDWTADGEVETRFISGLLYLNQPAKGGATAFPRARMPDGRVGTKIPPKRLSVVFFYDLLDDGNADELSFHAGLPVEEGNKWISPIWIWEPSRTVGEYMRKLKGDRKVRSIKHRG